MLVYLLMCRSLTYAQRVARELQRTGIATALVRAPKDLAGNGCNNAVRVSQRHYNDAIKRLKAVELLPTKVIMLEDDGTYKDIKF